MENSIQQKRVNNTVVITFSLLFERMSYYGFRSILILYMISETFQMENLGAITIYMYLSLFLLFTQLIGGIFGDFILKNKKAILLGGLLAAFGCVIVCIQDIYMLYAGLVLMTLGSGFLKPNMLAVYGKTYYNKPEYLDSAFSLYYLIINIGAFIGVALLAYISDEFGFLIAFGAVAIMYIVTSSLSLLISEASEKLEYDSQSLSSNNILYVILAIFVSVAFWGLYEISSTPRYMLLGDESFKSGIEAYFSKGILDYIDAFFLIPLLIIFGIIWLKFHQSRFLKIALGFLFGSLALVQFSQISMGNFDDNVFYLISGIFFYTIAEVFIGVIVLSIIARYTNPKYLTIVLALLASISGIIVYAIGQFTSIMYQDSKLFSYVGLAISLAITCMLFIVFFFARKYARNNE